MEISKLLIYKRGHFPLRPPQSPHLPPDSPPRSWLCEVQDSSEPIPLPSVGAAARAQLIGALDGIAKSSPPHATKPDARSVSLQFRLSDTPFRDRDDREQSATSQHVPKSIAIAEAIASLIGQCGGRLDR